MFGNQFWFSFERVEAVDAQSAARGPRFYDGLAETSDRGFIWVWEKGKILSEERLE